MLLLPPSVSALDLELNGDEFTNQETVVYTVRGEPYQNCTVLFGDNQNNMGYDLEHITLNATGVYVGRHDLTEDRKYDVTHYVYVQNGSSSAKLTYILRYSDAQRFAEEEEQRAFYIALFALVLGLIVTIVLIIAFREREKRLGAEGKLTVGEKAALQFHNRFQMNRILSVWDKVAPSNPTEPHRYDYKLIKWTELAICQAVRNNQAYIQKLMELSMKKPRVRKAVIENLKEKGIWPLATMNVDQEEAVLRPGEPPDLRTLLRKASPQLS